MEDSQKIQEIFKQIDNFVNEYEFYFLADRATKCKTNVDHFLLRLESLSQTPNEKKSQRAKALYWRGRLLDMLPQYQKTAEQYLNKAIKLNPVDADCWNTLGHVLWKKKDFEGSRKAFQMAIQNGGKNKVSLRSQSILLRSSGKPQQRQHYVEESVKLAKEALKLDFKDGQSWYILGNAYLSDFFVNMRKITDLENAIKAYSEAEKYLKYENPDLFVNKGTVYKYLQQYKLSLQYFQRAKQIDPSTITQQHIRQINTKIENLNNALLHAKLIKSKKLATLIKQLKQPYISSLKPGINRGIVISLRYLSTISQKGDTPASFLMLDAEGKFVIISLYNTNLTVYDELRENTQVQIYQPFIKQIQLGEHHQTCVQVFQINKIKFNSVSINDKFSPNIVVNDTFQK